jgi:hypothetical protein
MKTMELDTMVRKIMKLSFPPMNFPN